MSAASACHRFAAGLFSLVLLSLASCGGGDAPPADAVPASITLTASSASVGPGQTVTVTAVVKDAQGNVLSGQTLAWLSSNTAVATVIGGVVSGVTAGDATITASIGSVTSNAIVLSIVAVAPPGSPSSDELIDAALAAGEIDAETALTYKVFAYFADPRLPARFAGDGRLGFGEALALRQFVDNFATLSPATQQVLLPFLRRPSDKGSWADPDVRAATTAVAHRAALTREKPALLAIPRPVCNGPLQGWSVIDLPTAPVRVWWDAAHPSDGVAASKVAGFVERNVWPTLITSLGFAPPKDDTDTGCDGGNGKLDIYIKIFDDRGLTPKAFFWTGSDHEGPVFILINPNASDAQLMHATAHEISHAIAWAYTTKASQQSYGWFRDAFANWGATQVFPGNESLNAQASCHLRSMHLQLTDDSASYCSESSNLSRNYGGYLLLQFISKTSGGPAKIKDILVALKDHTTAVEAVNKTVAGGFKDLWPKYARKLWNQEPVLTKDTPATYKDWNQPSPPSIHEPFLSPDQDRRFDALVGSDAERATPLVRRLNNLSVRYYHYTFTGADEEKTRSVLFHNTFYNNWKNQQAVSVRAFYKVQGQWDEDDWTDSEWIGFCRDVKAQRIEELVVVLASGEWSGSNPVVEADEFPELKRNVVGCWGFKGLATRTDTLRSGRMGQITARFNARFETPANAPAGQYTDASTGRKRVFNVAPLFTGGSWGLVENYSQGSCNYAASGGGTDTSNTGSGKSTSSIVINNFNEALPANLRQPKEQLTGTVPRTYVGVGATLITVTGRVTGGSQCGGNYDTIVGPWLVTRETGVRSVIGANGRIKDTYSVPDQAPGDSIVYDWDLEPLREP